MTRVDFYVLADADPHNRLDVICKLAEKAMGRGQKVYIYGKNNAQLCELDQHLWSFRAMSFAAHRLIDATSSDTGTEEPIVLSGGEPDLDRNVLVNLDCEVPPFFSRFERTLEIVNQQEDVQQKGRERYLFYKQRGYPLQHHEI